MATVTKRRYAKRLQASERREQVLDAALRLIVETGSFHVTMQAVAESAGVTRPVVYDFFANVDELLTALLDRELERGQSVMADVVPGPESTAGMAPAELLADRTRAYLEAVRRYPDTWRMILMPPEGAPPALRERIRQGRENAHRGLTMLVAWGIGESEPLDGVDAEIFASGMLGAGERLARLVLADPERYSPDRIADQVRMFGAAITRTS